MITGELRDRVEAVVIGASTGGLEGLLTLLPSVPQGFKPPIFVVLHQPQDRSSLLVDLFAPRCAVPVCEAADKEPIHPGTIYFAPRGYHLLISPGPELALSVDEPVNFSRPSVDVLFETAAEVYGRRLLAILLSGANQDGASGVTAVRRAPGGTTLVQDPETAAATTMPTAALQAGAVDRVLTVEQMAELLRTLVSPS